MIDPDRGVLVVLDEAAAALVDAGYGDPYATTPGLRLRCLRASSCLQALGARVQRERPRATGDLPGLVVVALIVVLILDHDGRAAAAPVEQARAALRAVLRELV